MRKGERMPVGRGDESALTVLDVAAGMLPSSCRMTRRLIRISGRSAGRVEGRIFAQGLVGHGIWTQGYAADVAIAR